ncbi:hypothetical protein BBW65_07335 [Helicobacter enhydrae]|uniref:DUF5666 domain-containing protein n=1 Tax=Helicobacter enhydrae TaxID=222136 RepID=A0A1B1U7A2_9HELI|nr:DUF5666 domain-containing protein [Helicobacter enhydrae]ANV98620.1 hypothetical protein BBW65_07335 [Helicobacter enhydrae]
MKKFALIAGLSLSCALASDITGIITGIDNGKKTITINKTAIKVVPYTKIELDSCGIGWDSAKKFSDLKKGDLVEVDLMNDGNGFVAEEIEIKCRENRAY